MKFHQFLNKIKRAMMVKVICQYSTHIFNLVARAEMEMKTLRRAAPLSQCPRTDLNKRSLPRPTTTTA